MLRVDGNVVIEGVHSPQDRVVVHGALAWNGLADVTHNLAATADVHVLGVKANNIRTKFVEYLIDQLCSPKSHVGMYEVNRVHENLQARL